MPASRPLSPLCKAARAHFKEWLDDLLVKSELDGKDVPCHMYEQEGVYALEDDCTAVSNDFGDYLEEKGFHREELVVRCGALRGFEPGGSWIQVFLRPVPKG